MQLDRACRYHCGRQSRATSTSPASPVARYLVRLTTSVARSDEHGETVEIQGSLIDRTEQKHAEAMLRERDAQLLQSQKMEAIGRLAGGVAHDFNNLLTTISGYADLAHHACAASPEALECLEEVQKAAHSAAGVTRQLLAFSRKRPFEPATLDLNSVVAGLEKMLQRLLGEDVELVVRLAQERLDINVDRAQFEQVIVNLAVNARDAMPQGGRLTIETERDGADAVLLVSDAGCGMDGETKARIFEPFFTTKPPGQGTGLGLAMVYGTVIQSGGAITVESELRRGTTFKIAIPRVSPSPVSDAPPGCPDATPTGSETILLVEDEPGVRTLAQRILERAGYTVLVARDAAEAGSAAEAHSGPIDLLLSDVVMPGVSGPELAASFAAIRPRTRVLLMSGYADHALVRRYCLSSALLQKPFTTDALLTAVRRAMDDGVLVSTIA